MTGELLPLVDFPDAEFEARAATAQRLMRAEGLEALFFTTEAEMRYFTGFRTLFWQSATRPWFLVLPAEGGPIVVIPEIGEALMRRTWVRDIRSWPSPHPDDDGVSLLADVLRRYRVVGMPMGRESALRMPLVDFERMRAACPGLELRNASALIQQVREVKSPAEIDKLAAICAIGSRAFGRADHLFHEGQTVAEAFRALKVELLNQGADDVPYLVGGAGLGGYADVISPPSGRRLADGDVLMLDTGATLDGYFCDFDRNFAIGHAPDSAQAAHRTLFAAVEAALAVARPGARCADLFHAMSGVIEGAGYGGGDVGRFGHGLGIQLTEAPSLTRFDQTELRAGMVLTLEPGLDISDGKTMVHEENVVIEEDGVRLLTERTPPELPVI
jgi:Xaa-Pro aminopeptidase